MLFSPLKIKELELKNRIVMPPMCNYQAGADGKVTEWHMLHYGARAVGQVGLIIVEATGVEGRGRISARDLGLWQDDQMAGLKQIVDMVHRQGGKIAIQLNHAGRKCEVPGADIIAPSPLPFQDSSPVPREMTLEEIDQVVELFGVAARRAGEAGFDAVEIHGAHGYLINQFLSPLTNQRTDQYGGSVANRARLLGRIVERVRSVLPEGMLILVRVSAHDYSEGGNTPEIMAQLLQEVVSKGVDAVHVSSGAVTPVAPRAYPGYQIPFALQLRQALGLPVIGGGLISEPVQAEQVVKSGVDMVFLGRALLREPYWPLRAGFVLKEEVEWPESYLRGKYL